MRIESTHIQAWVGLGYGRRICKLMHNLCLYLSTTPCATFLTNQQIFCVKKEATEKGTGLG